jgi:hypothetical protein
MGKTALKPANSWMVVPGTTMTREGERFASRGQFGPYFLRFAIFLAAGFDFTAAFDFGP